MSVPTANAILILIVAPQGGACHRWGHGPGPAWGYSDAGWRWACTGPGWGWSYNGCPPGYWRGPWGHCRDTPYHGPLPNGGWQ
ncbi:hypothetical protein [Rhodoblastus sp.]|uniref:hypothetical protein n=1 Tax=Rhodoblastus sp. TaxID=1962975 RepID=UPI003F99426E